MRVGFAALDGRGVEVEFPLEITVEEVTHVLRAFFRVSDGAPLRLLLRHAVLSDAQILGDLNIGPDEIVIVAFPRRDSGCPEPQAEGDDAPTRGNALALILDHLAAHNPSLAEAVERDPVPFLILCGVDARGVGSSVPIPPGRPGDASGARAGWTVAEIAAAARLARLGFRRDEAAAVYGACGCDEVLAAHALLGML